MNLARFALQCTPQRFLEANLDSLRVGLLTKHATRNAVAQGTLVRRGDSTPILVYQDRILGLPLPRAEIQKAIAGTKDSTLFVVFGLGTGYLPQYLRRTTRAPIIVYEPNIGLLKTVLESGPLDFQPFEIVSNPHDLALAWGKFSGRRRDSIIVNTPGYSAAFPDECLALPIAVRRLVERVAITKNTYHKRARTWVTDVLRNLELLTTSSPFLALDGAYNNVPAFIVGAGPSLDKNIEQLARAKRKGIVFAANSSALSLGKHNIAPHVVCCLESIDISERLNTFPFINDVIRAFSLSASPETLRTGTGPLMHFYEALPQYCAALEPLTGVAGVNVCGSVSTAAFSLAQRLGCSPIVLVGQDMAFTNGSTYAGGTGYESSRATADKATGRVHLEWNAEIEKLHGAQHGGRHDSEPLMEAIAWGGDGEVMTGPSFMAINSWLSTTAALAETFASERRYVNATEGGARVERFEEMPLAALLDSLPDIDLTSEQLAQDASSRMPPHSRARLAQWCQLQAKQTRKIAVQARRVRRFSHFALHAMQNESPSQINRAFRVLDVEEAKLKTAVSHAPLVDAWSHTEVDQLVVTLNPDNASDSRSSAQAAIELGSKVAAAIEDAAKELEAKLQQACVSFAEPKAPTKGNSQCR